MTPYNNFTPTNSLMDAIAATGQTSFARKFQIPLRTVQQWATGEHNPPPYVAKMLLYIQSLETTDTPSD